MHMSDGGSPVSQSHVQNPQNPHNSNLSASDTPVQNQRIPPYRHSRSPVSFNHDRNITEYTSFLDIFVDVGLKGEDSVGLLSKLLFNWVSPLISLGSCTVLKNLKHSPSSSCSEGGILQREFRTKLGI